MRRMTSKLTVAFVVLLLLAAAAVTASSQTGQQKVTPIDRKPDAAREKALEGVKKPDANTDAPQYQELRCRGGGGLQFVVVEGRTDSSGEQTMYMTVYFKPAAQPAGLLGRNLQPGQCAFADRALRTDEPYGLIQEIVSFGQLKETLHGSTVDRSPTAAERFPDAKNVPQYLGDARHYWSFFVHQNAPLPSGRFEASYGRYWKPGLEAVRPIDTKGTKDNPYVLSPAKKEDVVSPIDSKRNLGALLGPSPGVPRVPNVVGLLFTDAESALIQAGFKPKRTFEDEPDPSIFYGHVRATVPAAGMLATDAVVEMKIPRAASRVGIGALGLSDLERRTGFDLDEGRYEEIFRGADIVLRKYENEPRVDENGHTYYAGGGLYIEPSDGAVLAALDDVRDIDSYGLGSALFYAQCAYRLKQPRTARVEIAHPNDGVATICVLTSKHQIAVVQFRLSDNPYNGVTDYKFHHAIFPPQPALVRPVDPKRTNRDNPYVLTPKKPE